MSGSIRAHIRSNVVGYIALFLVLTGGSAYALDGHNTVASDDIINGEVKTPDLAVRSVTSNRLAANSVKTGRVVDGTLLGADIADGSLTGTDVGPDSLTGTNVGPDSLTGANVDESSLGKVPSAAQADSAATASNASSLGGFAASAYKKGCEQGTVQGFAEVPGRANFSSSYVSLGNSYNCAGGPVYARRAGEGIYYVRFPGNSSTLGVGSVNYNSSGAEDDFVTLRSLTLNGDHFYIVLVHDADDGDEDDDTFTLMTF